MNRNHYSHSPAATARLRMGWVSSMPRDIEISSSRKFAVIRVAPQGVPSATPI